MGSMIVDWDGEPIEPGAYLRPDEYAVPIDPASLIDCDGCQ